MGQMGHLLEHVLSISEVSLIIARPPGLRVVPYSPDAAGGHFGIMLLLPERALKILCRIAPSAMQMLGGAGFTMVDQVLVHGAGGVGATGFWTFHP
jgi:hypothetical protein